MGLLRPVIGRSLPPRGGYLKTGAWSAVKSGGVGCAMAVSAQTRLSAPLSQSATVPALRTFAARATPNELGTDRLPSTGTLVLSSRGRRAGLRYLLPAPLAQTPYFLKSASRLASRLR